MAEHLHKPVDTIAVIRTKNTASQTSKTRAERISNVADAFMVAYPDLIRNKHILLLDDVITTGATLEVCAEAILKVPGTKVSMATLAYAVE
jgi:predicted amidophosphoribosyltransferase